MAGVRRVALAGLVLVVLGAVGCGGPITNDELSRGIQTLGATAAEGKLVAMDVVEDRTKTTFVRVEMRQLGQDAEHEAEKLNDAQPQSGNAAIKARAVKLAQDIDTALGDLEVSPSDRRLAGEVERRLDALSKQADTLAGRLA
jgi:hypothetical protein